MQDIEIFISSVQLPSFCMKNNALKLDWTLFWKCFQGTALQEGTVNSLFILGGQLHSGISLCCAKWQPAGLALGKGIGCQEQRALEKNLFCLVTDTQQGWCLPLRGRSWVFPLHCLSSRGGDFPDLSPRILFHLLHSLWSQRLISSPSLTEAAEEQCRQVGNHNSFSCSNPVLGESQQWETKE